MADTSYGLNGVNGDVNSKYENYYPSSKYAHSYTDKRTDRHGAAQDK